MNFAMERNNHTQLELFNQARAASQTKTRLPEAILKYLWTYEKTILLIISFLIMGIISFSLGVEKGKRMAGLRINSRLDMAMSAPKAQAATPGRTATRGTFPVPGATFAPQDSMPARVPQSQPLKKEDMPAQLKADEYLAGYTIQVATYQTKKYAQKEAESIRRRGYSALVLSKGGYIVVCVGKFPNQDKARSLLPELKKDYRSCFIRRL